MKMDPYLVFAGGALLLLIAGGSYAVYDLSRGPVPQEGTLSATVIEPQQVVPSVPEESLPAPEPEPSVEDAPASPPESAVAASPPPVELNPMPPPEVPPQPPAPPPVVVDLRQRLQEVGFSGEFLEESLERYVRFGTLDNEQRYWKGDQFDRIEARDSLAEHRKELLEHRFRISNLSFVAFGQRNDVETKGLMAELLLPLRVRGSTPFYRDFPAFSGDLAVIHPAEIDLTRAAFLTKEGTLRACALEEIAFVEQNRGYVYHPEAPRTALVLMFQGDTARKKDLARNTDEYSVEIELSHLVWRKAWRWGYYQRLAYFEVDCDCERLQDLLPPILRKSGQEKLPPLTYFPTEDSDTAPELLTGRLEWLRVIHKSGELIGQYSPRAR